MSMNLSPSTLSAQNDWVLATSPEDFPCVTGTKYLVSMLELGPALANDRNLLHHLERHLRLKSLDMGTIWRVMLGCLRVNLKDVFTIFLLCFQAILFSPLKSSDLSPLEFSVWRTMEAGAEAKTHVSPLRKTSKLKASVSTEKLV